MLPRLEAKAGITCNPYTFRRTFAVLLQKAGIDTMTIRESAVGKAWKWCSDIPGHLVSKIV
jgi:hypothetical protein